MNKEAENKKPRAKKAAKPSLPKELAQVLNANPGKIAFLSKDGKNWHFREHSAIKDFGKDGYTKVSK